MTMTLIVSITRTRKVCDPSHKHWTEELCIGDAAVRGDLRNHNKRSHILFLVLEVRSHHKNNNYNIVETTTTRKTARSFLTRLTDILLLTELFVSRRRDLAVK